ncbi:DNA topoisomerase IB [Iodidimonas sp. SYSU 1G8]|uniref:DNA topoisomerase IB n=1 Tax=Iodidimonas sp. SYSU 1G8 TaxID=3133967 RepID=UPI0031FE8E7E
MDATIAASIPKGLKLVASDSLPILRRRCGRGYLYFDASGCRVNDPAILDRIRRLAIPPAYEDVRIAAHAKAHLQAIGRDQAGRVQYRYHPDWEHVREENKAGQLAAICAVLPRIRRRIRADLALPDTCARKALAGIVMLIDRTHIRIGCENYVHSGRSRGASTLLKRNVQHREEWLDVSFRGKGGKAFAFSARIPLLARAIPDWLDLPGTRLFQYRNQDGKVCRVNAGDTNAYLQEISGVPITAKTFRTMAASAAATEKLGLCEPASSPTARRRQIKAVMSEIADMLGNTPTIVRKSYVHGKVLDAFEAETLSGIYEAAKSARFMSRREVALARLFAG